MPALPSFVELMASLGLENTKPGLPSSLSHPIHSSSPSIVVSEHDSDLDRHSTRHRVARYSPYSAPISHTRRYSSSSLSNDGNDSDRAASPSPRVSSRIMDHRPVALKLGAESRHMHAASETEANMPISTFVRRKTPQSSPVSPTFAHRTRASTRKQSQSPKLPVSLPTLPPVFAQSSRPATPDDASLSPHHSDDDAHLSPDYYLNDRRNSLPYGQDEEDARRYVLPIACVLPIFGILSAIFVIWRPFFV